MYNRMRTACTHSTNTRVNVVRIDVRAVIEYKPISEQIQTAVLLFVKNLKINSYPIEFGTITASFLPEKTNKRLIAFIMLFIFPPYC